MALAVGASGCCAGRLISPLIVPPIGLGIVGLASAISGAFMPARRRRARRMRLAGAPSGVTWRISGLRHLASAAARNSSSCLRHRLRYGERPGAPGSARHDRHAGLVPPIPGRPRNGYRRGQPVRPVSMGGPGTGRFLARRAGRTHWHEPLAHRRAERHEQRPDADAQRCVERDDQPPAEFRTGWRVQRRGFGGGGSGGGGSRGLANLGRRKGWQ